MATATVKRPADPVVPTAADRLAEARATKARTLNARVAASARLLQLRALVGGVDGQREVAVEGVTYGSLSGVVTTGSITVPVAADQSPEALALAQLDLPEALRAELMAIVADQRASASLDRARAEDRRERVAHLAPVAREAQVQFFAAALDRFIATEYAPFVQALDAVDAELGDQSLTSALRWPEFDRADAGSLVNFRKQMFAIA